MLPEFFTSYHCIGPLSKNEVEFIAVFICYLTMVTCGQQLLSANSVLGKLTRCIVLNWAEINSTVPFQMGHLAILVLDDALGT